MSDSASSQLVYSMWVCPKCGSTVPEDLPFCPRCAAEEGKPNPEAAPEDKTGALAQLTGKAIEWALQHGQIKTSEVLSQLTKRGYQASSLNQLRALPTPVLDRLASSYIGANRLGATGSGLGAGLPGGLAAFATIPADITALLYFGMRCISGISQSYSFESVGVPGQTLALLSLAYASRLETLVIGQRRLEIYDLARFLVNHPTPYAELVQANLLKQLASYLTIDFAKTSWATFLPIVGGVVNGIDNFWFLGEVGKRGRVFFRSLLLSVAPFQPLPAAAPRAVAQVAAPKLPTIVEMPGFNFELSEQIVLADLFYPETTEAELPLVIVAWEGSNGRKLAERLAENGLAALWPSSQLDKNGLTSLTDLLESNLPPSFPPEIATTSPGLLAFGSAARAALPALGLDSPFGAVVLYNPTGPAESVTVGLPLLLHQGESDQEGDPAWAEQIQAAAGRGPVAVSSYPQTGHDFTNPASSDYDRTGSEWAWADSRDWFRQYLGK